MSKNELILGLLLLLTTLGILKVAEIMMSGVVWLMDMRKAVKQDKEHSALDRLVTRYYNVGYEDCSLGRSRRSEDADWLLPVTEKEDD